MIDWKSGIGTQLTSGSRLLKIISHNVQGLRSRPPFSFTAPAPATNLRSPIDTRTDRGPVWVEGRLQRPEPEARC
jgi:hypothetical protein